MVLYFKQNNPNSPTKEVLDAFNIKSNIRLLTGGENSSYLANNIVLKPVTNDEEINWVSEFLLTIKEDGFRIPKPIKTRDNKWIYKGWSALTYLPGKEIKGRWVEKIQISAKFHKAISTIKKPLFISTKNNPWAIADRMIWGEQSLEYGPQLNMIISKLKGMLKPININAQLIHGDLTGNILFQKNNLPAIIDFSFYWRPAKYAEAIITVDSIVWENSGESLLKYIDNTFEMNQLIIRAIMWRIKSTEECIKQFGRGNLKQINSYQYLIDLVTNRIKFQN